MRWWLLLSIALLLGCPARKPGSDVIPLDSGTAGDSGFDDPDAGPDDAETGRDAEVDGGQDAAIDAGEDAGVPRATAAFTTSGGGGSRQSPNYELRLIVAPNTPAANRESTSYRVRLGAGPVQHGQ